MVKFDHDLSAIPDAFNMSKAETKKVFKMFKWLTKVKPVRPLTWTLQRIWIDETISDNAKCFLIFALGRAYQDCVRKEKNDL